MRTLFKTVLPVPALICMNNSIINSTFLERMSKNVRDLATEASKAVKVQYSLVISSNSIVFLSFLELLGIKQLPGRRLKHIVWLQN